MIERRSNSHILFQKGEILSVFGRCLAFPLNLRRFLIMENSRAILLIVVSSAGLIFSRSHLVLLRIGNSYDPLRRRIPPSNSLILISLLSCSHRPGLASPQPPFADPPAPQLTSLPPPLDDISLSRVKKLLPRLARPRVWQVKPDQTLLGYRESALVWCAQEYIRSDDRCSLPLYDMIGSGRQQKVKVPSEEFETTAVGVNHLPSATNSSLTLLHNGLGFSWTANTE